MDIPNLADSKSPQTDNNFSLSLPLTIIIIVVAVAAGFWVSRFPNKTASINSAISNSSSEPALSTDNISNSAQLQIGKLYGDTQKSFSDSAQGTIEKGSINGEGTHILNREGGKTQRASLTSSTVDLDLFIGKKVEVKGQTNSSTKTGWLLDVGSIKILE